MFNELLAESVAKATFWILIIFALGITIRFLIRDYVNFILEDVDKKTGEEE
jgi:hypothetical protein